MAGGVPKLIVTNDKAEVPVLRGFRAQAATGGRVLFVPDKYSSYLGNKSIK